MYSALKSPIRSHTLCPSWPTQLRFRPHPEAGPPTCQINNFLLHLPFGFPHQPSYLDWPAEGGSRKGRALSPLRARRLMPQRTYFHQLSPPTAFTNMTTLHNSPQASYRPSLPGLPLLRSKTVRCLQWEQYISNTKGWKQFKLCK